MLKTEIASVINATTRRRQILVVNVNINIITVIMRAIITATVMVSIIMHRIHDALLLNTGRGRKIMHQDIISNLSIAISRRFSHLALPRLKNGLKRKELKSRLRPRNLYLVDQFLC
jgi:hypothetical protein